MATTWEGRHSRTTQATGAWGMDSVREGEGLALGHSTRSCLQVQHPELRVPWWTLPSRGRAGLGLGEWVSLLPVWCWLKTRLSPRLLPRPALEPRPGERPRWLLRSGQPVTGWITPTAGHETGLLAHYTVLGNRIKQKTWDAQHKKGRYFHTFSRTCEN